MKLWKLLKENRKAILKIARKHGAKDLRVFGSAARGDDGPKSDIDLLVKLTPSTSLLSHIALIQELEGLLGRKIDVVNEKALHWYIKDRILDEARPL